MKYLITGNEGMIGSCIQKHLEDRGDSVIGMDLKSGKDASKIEDYPDVEELDGVFHLASHMGVEWTQRNSLETQRNTIESAFAVLKFLKRFEFSPPLLFTSTSEVYDIELNRVGFARLGYAISKLAAETILLTNSSTILTRIFNTTSREQSTDFVMAKWAEISKHQLTSKEEYLTVYGDGQQTRAFSLAEDVAGVLVECLDRRLGGTILEVGSPNDISMINLARLFMYETGVKHRIQEDYPLRDEVIRKADLTKLEFCGVDTRALYKSPKEIVKEVLK